MATDKNRATYFVMASDSSMVSGWRLCGSSQSMKRCKAIQEAYTVYLNGKPWRVPVIWDEAQYDNWQKNSMLVF